MSGEEHYFGQPADPATKECDWCGPGSKASCAFEVYKPRKKLGTAQYVYTCARHARVGQESSRAPRRAA